MRSFGERVELSAQAALALGSQIGNMGAAVRTGSGRHGRRLLGASCIVIALLVAGCSSTPSGATSTTSAAPVTTTSRPASSPVNFGAPLLIAFSSPNDGYGAFVHQSGNANSPTCTFLLGRTRDGGRRYGPVVKIPLPACGFPAVYLTTDGLGDAFFYGEGLFATHDYGRTWARVDVQGAIVDITAVGRSIWMLESTSCRGREKTPCPLLLESNDGGRSWVRSPSEPQGASLVPRPEVWSNALVRTNVRSGYMITDPALNHGSTTVPLWFTDNAGITWSKRQIECGTISEVLSVGAAAGGTLLAVCGFAFAQGFTPKAVSRSADGGRTWTVYEHCVQPGSPCSGALDQGYYGTLDVVTSSVAWMMLARGALAVTRDGGRHWRVAPDNLGDPGGSPYTEVFFFGTQDAVVNGGGTIFTTTDGGVRWEPVKTVAW
jgi:photosystem II stability/assembly factor-like uncharacterized protein